MAYAGFESFSFDKRGCVECPEKAPSCPVCPVGYACQGIIRSCDACQSTTCVLSPATSTAVATPSSTSSSPNIGAIAGGVIGGVIAITLLTYLVWRFCIKNKRQQYEETWAEFHEDSIPTEKDFAAHGDIRASTHTMHSIASTVLTRASNIIQIAYIPGVTNRSTPSTPGLLVPPVPPIPIALASPTSSHTYEDQHFFMPGDLRDSTYSGMTDRTSYARNSVASTIYGKNAVVSPVPVQTFTRAKAAVVSVKSSGQNTPGQLTPPVPSVDWDKYNVRGGPASPAFSVGSTFLNSATSATQMKPQVVRVASSGTSSTGTSLKSKLSQSTGGDSPRTLVGRDSAAITVIEDTPSMEQGPFSDPPARAVGHTRDGSLSAVIEEATLKAQSDVRGGLGLKREGSPFGDEHATNQ